MEQSEFNTYKDGLNLRFLRDYCQEHGTVRKMMRGETLEEAGEPARWVAYIKKGCFKYMTHNQTEGRDYCTGFAFEGEFVADYPNCLKGGVSEVTIEADMVSEVLVIEGKELQRMYNEDPEKLQVGVRILENLFMMVFGRMVDRYRYTPRERYEQLMARCPQIIEQLSLQDIASFLGITATYLSRSRKEIAEETE